MSNVRKACAKRIPQSTQSTQRRKEGKKEESEFIWMSIEQIAEQLNVDVEAVRIAAQENTEN